MKKHITTLIAMAILAATVPLLATTTFAQTTYYRTRDGRVVVLKRPNFYRRHRKAINIGGGTVAGALIGGLIGGKKGLIIGGLAGAGGGALFTHKQRPKNYYRRYYVRPYYPRRSYRNY
jgi:hypothetical protein